MNPALDRDRTQFGKYTLVERLGRGGMAEVWKAQGSRSARAFAHAGGQAHPAAPRRGRAVRPDVRRRGAAVGARSTTPTSCRCTSSATSTASTTWPWSTCAAATSCSVMRALREPSRGRRRWGWPRTSRARCAARSHYAHALTDDDGTPLRLIHRDVSPSNVMLGFDGAVKLLDFGIAKALAEARREPHRTGMLKGKFGYMSPEQVEGQGDRSSRRSVRRRHRAARDADAAAALQGRTATCRRWRWCATRRVDAAVDGSTRRCRRSSTTSA